MREDTWTVRIDYFSYSRLDDWIVPYTNFKVNRLRIQSICGSLVIL